MFLDCVIIHTYTQTRSSLFVNTVAHTCLSFYSVIPSNKHMKEPSCENTIPQAPEVVSENGPDADRQREGC